MTYRSQKSKTAILEFEIQTWITQEREKFSRAFLLRSVSQRKTVGLIEGIRRATLLTLSQQLPEFRKEKFGVWSLDFISSTEFCKLTIWTSDSEAKVKFRNLLQHPICLWAQWLAIFLELCAKSLYKIEMNDVVLRSQRMLSFRLFLSEISVVNYNLFLFFNWTLLSPFFAVSYACERNNIQPESGRLWPLV